MEGGGGLVLFHLIEDIEGFLQKKIDPSRPAHQEGGIDPAHISLNVGNGVFWALGAIGRGLGI